jgi:hypothetical protein
LLGKCRRHSRAALSAPSVKLQHSYVYVQFGVNLKKKPSNLHRLPPLVPMQFQPLSFVLDQDLRPHFSGSILESLKVIAFDKNSVNTYISSAILHA